MATYIVKGTTAEDSSPATNLIIAYKADRSDPATIGEELGRVTANSNGLWEISFDDWSSHVFVVALDPTVEIKYKAKMKDWVIGLLYTDPNIGNYPVEADPAIDNVVTQYGFEEVDIASLENQAKKVYAVDIDFFNSPTLTVITPGMDSKSLKFETGSHAEIRTHISSGSTWSDAGAVDCTLEGMFYLNGTAGNLFHHGASGAGSSTGSAPLEKNGLQIEHAADGTISVYSGNLSEYGASSYLHLNTAAGALLFNQWVHFAFVVESNVPKIYVNGVSQPLTLGNGGYPNTNLSTCHMWNTVPMCLNAKNWDGGVPSNGQQVQYSVVNNNIDAMDEVRITLGLARYTADFVPSTTGYTRFVPGKEATILDPYFYNNILLLRCNVDGSDSFLDEVSTNYNLASGAATQVSATKKFGAAAGKFQTSADYLTIPHHPSYEIGDQLFTMEAWVWIDGAPPSYPQVMGMSDTVGSAASMHWSFAITPQRQISFNIYNAAGNNWLDPISNSGSVTVGEWVHVCVERISTAADGIRVYVNGVQTAASSSNPSLDTHAVPNVDLITGGKSTAALNGYLDDVRITVGVNRYGAAFTPPTSEHPPFEYDPLEILTPTSLPYPVEADPYFNDNVSLLPFDNSDGQTVMTDVMGLSWDTFGSAQIDTAESKFGGSSLLLNGATDYLSNGTVSYWKFLHDGTTDYTMEGWVRPAAVASSQVVSGTDGASSTKHGVSLNITPDGVFEFLVAKGVGGAVYAARLTGVIPVIANVWVHVAAVVQAGVAKLYVGGVADGSESLASPSQSDASASLVIGKYYAGNSLPLIGHIDDFRITKAVRYTGSFTPPTEALPTTRFVPGTEPPILDPYFADVEALFHFDEGAGVGVLNSEVGGLTITPEGSTATQEIEFLFGGSSIFCPHDSGSFADLVGLADIGTGDFTLEMAINCQPSGNSDSRFLIDCRGTNETGTTNKIRWLFSNGENTLTLYNGGGTLITGLVNVRDGAWHWVAISRKAGTIRMFIDGVQDGADYAGSSQIFIFGNKGMRIGQYSADDIQALGAEAYIDEFRFTRSGRYDANFTVPTKAFPNFEYNPNTLHPLELDPYFDDVFSLRHFDEDGVDLISTNSWSSDVSVVSTQTKFGTNAAHYNGSTEYSLIFDDVFLDLTQPFTLETWIYPEENTDYQVIFSIGNTNNNDNRFLFYLRGGGRLYAYADDGPIRLDLGTVDTPVSLNTWHHVALSSDGTTVYMHLNGILVGSQAWISSPFTPAENRLRWGVGWLGSVHQYYQGYMDDQRITMGSCRYTGQNFTPPTEAFPDTRFDPAREPTILDPYFADVVSRLHFDEADGSTNVVDDAQTSPWTVAPSGAEIDVGESKFGGSSFVFTGGGYALHPASGDWNFLASAKGYCFEAWIRPTAHTGIIACTYGAGSTGWTGSNLEWLAYVNAASQLEVQFRNGTPSPVTYNGGALSLSAWQHVAIDSDGATVRGFINGVEVFSGSAAATINGHLTPTIELGRLGTLNVNYLGHIDDARFTKASRYSGGFTIPAEAYPDFEYDPLEILSSRAVYPVEIDPLYNSIFSLLHMEGANLDTTAADTGPNPLTPQFTNDAIITNAHSTFGSTSLYLDGALDHVKLSLDKGVCNFLHDGTGGTFECRFKHDGVLATALIFGNTGGSTDHVGIYFFSDSVGVIRLLLTRGVNGQAPIDIESAAGTIVANQDYAIAFTVGPNKAEIFVDGVSVASGAPAYAYSTADAHYTSNLGHQVAGDDTKGYYSEVRFTKAVRYDGDYTVADAPFPDSRFEPGKEPTILDADYPSVEVQLNGGGADGDTTIVDSSKHNRTPTVLGVVEYDSGQALFGETTILTSGGALRYDGINWGQTFTAEVYFRTAANSGSQWVMSCRSEKTGREWLVYLNGSSLIFWADGTNIIQETAPTANNWHHVAVTYDGAAFNFFIDGVYKGQWATGYSENEDVMCFGGAYTNTSFVNGHIAGARVSRDLIRYTADFTPPAALFSTMEYDPLEDLSKRTEVDPYFDNVVSLLKFDGIDAQKVFYDAATQSDWLYHATGIELDDAQKKYGATSALFSGGYLHRESVADFDLLQNGASFTVEAWIRPTAASTFIFVTNGTTSPNWTVGELQLVIEIKSTAALGVQFNQQTGVQVQHDGGTILTNGTWQHIAVTCDGVDMRGFIDGALVFTGTAAAMQSGSAAPNAEIGRLFGYGATFAGHIDDLRVTKGVCRYIEGFTPPASLPTSRYTYAP